MSIETGIASYLDKLFDEWKENRLASEKKWNRNLNAIKGKDNGTWKHEEAEGWRSDTFIKLIKAKVFVAYSILIDVLLQGGMIPFALKHSQFEEKRRMAEGEISKGSEDVEKDIDDMTDKIREQLNERRADREYLKKILSLAYYGEAYSKYNIKPVIVSMYAPSIGTDAYGNEIEIPEYPEYKTSEKLVPGHEYRSVWSIVTDPENGDIQTNKGTFEYGYISPYELREKLGGNKGKFYIDDAIKDVISEYSKTETLKDNNELPPGLREIQYRKSTIMIREYWGRVPRSLADEFESDRLGKNISTVNPDWEEDIGDEVDVLVEMANKTVIRYVRREKRASRPYKKCIWEEELDENTGISIADNLEGIQTSLNGMQRAFEDNKKLSGNVITATKKRFLGPGVPDKVVPGMNIPVSESCDDARKAIAPIIIPDVGESLLSGIGLLEKWADTVSQVPTIAQGFSLSKHKPDTLGEIQLMMQNLGKYFGMVIRNIDESFIEQEIKDLYDYNMIDDSYEGQKSDMKVNATGFTSFQNKVVVAQKIRELLTLALSDSSGLILREIKLRAHLEEIYKNMDVDIDKFLKSEAEKNKDMEQAQAQAQAQAQQEAEDAQVVAEKERRDKEEDFQRDMVKEQVKAAVK